ncbi:hypothetical protein SASPL_143508 [Salvia splendens]|uniref:Uncharacterized protein n=1 Tax=Salvia splendens TaxID=180675 RepID=A0A8X8WMC7_SALSN|nr:hypothetical protein SASPL_143508 [Salvia splendens]
MRFKIPSTICARNVLGKFRAHIGARNFVLAISSSFDIPSTLRLNSGNKRSLYQSKAYNQSAKSSESSFNGQDNRISFDQNQIGGNNFPVWSRLHPLPVAHLEHGATVSDAIRSKPNCHGDVAEPRNNILDDHDLKDRPNKL